MLSSSRLFSIVGYIFVMGSLFHIVCLIGGPDWIAFAGAPSWAVESLREGTWPAPVATLSIAGLLAMWAAYSFSAANKIPRLPFLKTILGMIAFILIVRGVIFLPALPNWNWSHPLYIFHGLLSFLVLTLGLMCAAGLFQLIKLPPEK